MPGFSVKVKLCFIIAEVKLCFIASLYVCALPGKVIPEMTYIVSGGMLDHSVMHACICQLYL